MNAFQSTHEISSWEWTHGFRIFGEGRFDIAFGLLWDIKGDGLEDLVKQDDGAAPQRALQGGAAQRHFQSRDH